MVFRRIFDDFKNKKLMPLKILFFIHASTIFVIYPYLTIHMRELGISVEETAIMSAVTPIVAILMPPLAGLVADKIGNFKVILAIFSALGGLSALLFLLVPVGRIHITYPKDVIFEVACPFGKQLQFYLYHKYPCNPLGNGTLETDITVQSCGFICKAVVSENDSHAIENVPTYKLNIVDTLTNSSTLIAFEHKFGGKRRLPDVDSARVTRRVLVNDENYSKAVRRLANHTYFFPAPTLYNFSCGVAEDLSDEYSSKIPDYFDRFTCLFGGRERKSILKNEFGYKFPAEILVQKQTADDVTEGRQLYNVKYLKNPNYADDFAEDSRGTVCFGNFFNNKHVHVLLHLEREGEGIYKTMDLGTCAPRCLATSPREKICSNKNDVVELDPGLTFWSYLSVRLLVSVVSGTAFAMFEGATIAILRENNADYGLQRIYGTIGGMISSPVAGWLIDYASYGKDYTDFRLIFMLYAVLKVLSAVFMLFLDLEFKAPATNILSDVRSVIKQIELIALYIAVFMLGTFWGFIESFLFWLIQDLGGSKSLMGITITVGGIAGIPLLILSGPLINRYGVATVLSVGFLFYSIRLVGYSGIYNPWYSLIFEAMESITSSLSYTAAVTHAAELSLVTTDTSVQGILGGLYYGVGKGAGSLVGGYSIKIFGTRTTYRIFAAVAIVTGVLYFAFNYFFMRNRSSEPNTSTNTDSEKSPPHLVEVDLPNKALPSEIAEINLGYQETEFGDNKESAGKSNGV